MQFPKADVLNDTFARCTKCKALTKVVKCPITIDKGGSDHVLTIFEPILSCTVGEMESQEDMQYKLLMIMAPPLEFHVASRDTVLAFETSDS